MDRSYQNADLQKLLANIDSRASFDFDFKHDSLLAKRSQRLFIRLASRALLASIGGSFASARPLYLTGFAPKTRTAFSLRPPTLSPSNPSRQGSFSSSEVARRAMNVYLARGRAQPTRISLNEISMYF